MAQGRNAPKVPVVIERFIKALVVTTKAVSLYPPSSNIPTQTAHEVVNILSSALAQGSELRIVVTKDALLFQDVPIYPGNPIYSAFSIELYNRKLSEVRFHSGAEPQDIVAFASLICMDQRELEMAGGFESRLWELGVGAITVKEAHVSIVDAPMGGDGESDAPVLSRRELDELLEAASAGRTRDKLAVARFMANSGSVSAYLAEAYEQAEQNPLVLAGDRFAQLAAIAAGSDEPAKYALLRSLAEALNDLDPELRRTLLVDEILPEARTDEAVASTLRQLDLDEVCKMLADGASETAVSREGLARAIRTLAMISMTDRDEVVTAAGAALRGAGVSEEFVSGVIEMSNPSKLTVREGSAAAVASEQPTEAIFKLLDLAPTAAKSIEDEYDPRIVALRAESERGITDGDIIMALVALVGLDNRPEQFANTATVLEDSLDVLVDRGEIDVAADACDALSIAAQNESLAPAQRERLRRAIGRFTKPTDIRAMANALRVFKPDTREHQAARRLLDAIGGFAIVPLLEQLADEPDMAVRKSVIEILSGLAPHYVTEFGAHLSDPRWYVVRNVVSILGSTKSSAVLPYIERTLHHPEARVRREAIRALSGIRDRRAEEMLVVALGDADAQNVQLAARYLGTAGVSLAIPALEQVARGEGRGNRDTGPRVEAIEALGRLGARQAIPTLESLAGKRSIIGAARARELRAAAESAISQIQSGGGVR